MAVHFLAFFSLRKHSVFLSRLQVYTKPSLSFPFWRDSAVLVKYSSVQQTIDKKIPHPQQNEAEPRTSTPPAQVDLQMSQAGAQV